MLPVISVLHPSAAVLIKFAHSCSCHDVHVSIQVHILTDGQHSCMAAIAGMQVYSCNAAALSASNTPSTGVAQC